MSTRRSDLDADTRFIVRMQDVLAGTLNGFKSRWRGYQLEVVRRSDGCIIAMGCPIRRKVKHNG